MFWSVNSEQWVHHNQWWFFSASAGRGSPPTGAPWCAGKKGMARTHLENVTLNWRLLKMFQLVISDRRCYILYILSHSSALLFLSLMQMFMSTSLVWICAMSCVCLVSQPDIVHWSCLAKTLYVGLYAQSYQPTFLTCHAYRHYWLQSFSNIFSELGLGLQVCGTCWLFSRTVFNRLTLNLTW